MNAAQYRFRTFYKGNTQSLFKIESILISTPILRRTAPERGLGSILLTVSERVSSAAVLVLLSPVLLISAAGLAVLSGRTPFIAHRRVGWRGSTLWMLKLRTMWDTQAARQNSGWIEYIDDDAGPLRKQAADPRITSAFARFCRRHSLDELPQLLHVVRGEMSLVGPRPLTAGELRTYYGSDVPEVLGAKPGLAGLWQISGRNRLTYSERKQLDLELVRNRSVRLYLRILFRTAAEVWDGGNTW